MDNNMNKRGCMTTCRALFLAIACVMPLAHTAYAEQSHSKQLARMAGALNLTDHQRQQLKQVHRSKRDEMMKLHNAMEDNHEALERLNPSASNYEKQLVKLANEKAQLVKQKIMQEGKMRARVYGILTPEQRKKAAKMKKHRPRQHHGNDKHESHVH